MRRFIRDCGFALVAAGSPICIARADSKAPDDFDSVIVADRIRAAFYERAPRSVRRGMQRALDAACAAARDDPPRDMKGRRVPFEPFCAASRPHFLREVLINGAKLSEGLICLDDYIGEYKFLTPDMLDHDACVRVDADYTTKVLQVRFEWLDVGDA